jgi:hypothetical protein
MMMKHLLTLTLLCFGLLAQAQIPSYVPTNGLVGWWPFNGNANDESGNGNHGTVNGATLMGILKLVCKILILCKLAMN